MFRKPSRNWPVSSATTAPGDVDRYDPRVFDLLCDLIAAAGRFGAEIQVICGYRTPWSNESLRTHTFGVALNSLDMQAEAIDIRLPGVSTAGLRNVALACRAASSAANSVSSQPAFSAS